MVCLLGFTSMAEALSEAAAIISPREIIKIHRQGTDLRGCPSIGQDRAGPLALPGGSRENRAAASLPSLVEASYHPGYVPDLSFPRLALSHAGPRASRTFS